MIKKKQQNEFMITLRIWQEINEACIQLPDELIKIAAGNQPGGSVNLNSLHHVLYFDNPLRRNALQRELQQLHAQLPEIFKIHEDLIKELKSYECLKKRVDQCIRCINALECALLPIESMIATLESSIAYHQKSALPYKIWHRLINSHSYRAWKHTFKNYAEELDHCKTKYSTLKDDYNFKNEEISRYNLYLQKIDNAIIELEEILTRFIINKNRITEIYRLH